MGRIDVPTLDRDPVIGCLDNRILFRMEASAELVPLAGTDILLLPDATDILTMGEPHGRAVISG